MSFHNKETEKIELVARPGRGLRWRIFDNYDQNGLLQTSLDISATLTFFTLILETKKEFNDLSGWEFDGVDTW